MLEEANNSQELQKNYDKLQVEHFQLKQQFKDLGFSHSALDQSLSEEIQSKIRAKTTIASYGFAIQELQSKLQDSQKELAKIEEKLRDAIAANQKLIAENRKLNEDLEEFVLSEEIAEDGKITNEDEAA